MMVMWVCVMAEEMERSEWTWKYGVLQDFNLTYLLSALSFGDYLHSHIVTYHLCVKDSNPMILILM